MRILRNFLILAISLSLCNADINNTSQRDYNSIDSTHKVLSDTIIKWSEELDTTLSGYLGNDETNISESDETKMSLDSFREKVKSADAFFQNKRYLHETDDTFVTVRIDSEFQSKESNNFKVKMGGQLPLRKTKQLFKIFLNDIIMNNTLSGKEEEGVTPKIGLQYSMLETYGIHSKYSLGTRGIHPFVRARFYMTILTNSWIIGPSQMFKYSLENKFEEETNIYFDNQYKDRSLLRVHLHRKTQDEIDGMDYALTLQYYWSPVKNMGLRISQSFVGNTKYPYIVDNNVNPPQIKTFGGINNYATSFSLRQSIWRKWFFYEVRPGVSFHKDYAYEPNYTLRFLLDFHFGQSR